MRSQKLCLTIPKKMPDNPKKYAWWFQKLCLAMVRHHFWDSFWGPKNNAWRPAVQDIRRDSGYAWKLKATVYWFLEITICWNYTELLRSNSQVATSRYVLFLIPERIPEKYAWQLSSISFGTVRHHIWDCQEQFLRSAGIIFEISCLFFGV